MDRQNTTSHDPLELVTTAQAAELLNVHPNTVRNWADADLLPSYRIGPRRDRRFRRDDVLSLLTPAQRSNRTALKEISVFPPLRRRPARMGRWALSVPCDILSDKWSGAHGRL